MCKKNLVFVTGNANKLKEVIEIVGKTFPLTISTKKIDLTETQGEPDDISRNKCLEAAKLIGGPVLVEDTCLAFHALKGLPGPYIKCFLTKLGAEGLPRLLEGFADKSASAICTFAFHSGAAEDKVVLCKGVVEGQIVTPKGKDGFGWDPIFLPDGFSKTFGEMTAAEKHDVSHRRRAVDALKKHFERLHS